ncbi:hypothetical protein G7Y79_00078g100040 [Physcia stellaris]|nr:hypothetical protein G7Y79_00078g100040 [Physcia stellaris]
MSYPHLLPLLALLFSTISAHPRPQDQAQNQVPTAPNPWAAINSQTPLCPRPRKRIPHPLSSSNQHPKPAPFFFHLSSLQPETQSQPQHPRPLRPTHATAIPPRPQHMQLPHAPSPSNPLTPLSALSTNASVFGITCLNDGTGMRLNPPSCASNALELCYRLSYLPSASPRGTWLWSASSLTNCTFGVYLPLNESTSARIPGYARCVSEVLGGLARGCAGAAWAGNGDGNPAQGAVVGVEGGEARVPNVGAINLRRLPSVEQSGVAVDERYASYLMVAQTFDMSVVADALEELRGRGWG